MYRNDIFLLDMMDKIILGLLSQKSMTVYDIKIAMDKSISQFYSNSFGSINPAIKKLEQQLLITCSEHVENSRLKKTYAITSKGRQIYKAWIAEPIKQGRIKDEVLIKIFFLGDIDKIEQKKVINAYLEELTTSKETLENQKEGIENMQLSSTDQVKIKFQVSTLQFGIDYIAFKQQWFQDLLDKI